MTERGGTRFRAPPREVGYVLEEYEAQRDPLGLSSHDDPGSAAADVVAAALGGVDPGTTRRIVAALGQRNVSTVAGLDRLTARLMAWRGIDPLVLTWLSSLSAEIAEATLRFPCRVCWHTDEVLLLPARGKVVTGDQAVLGYFFGARAKRLFQG